MFTNVELRKLPAGSLYSIVDVLETNNDWKRVMSIIPKNPQSEHFEPKYSNEHIRLIEDHAKATGRKCAEILFEEWGTSGRIRPTLNTLKEVTIKAEIYRAADEIALILQEAPPNRPQDGPAAPVDIDITKLLEGQSLDLSTMASMKKEYFEKSTKQLIRQTDDLEKMIGNRTTVQIKSESDLIKFSSDLETAELPNISAIQSWSSETTAQIVLESDLIRFSNIQPPIIQIDEPTLESNEIPNFSAIMSKSNVDNRDYSNYTTSSVTQSEAESFVSQTTEKTSSHQVDDTGLSSEMYQMSFPNIELGENNSNIIDSSILHDENLIHFDYKLLEVITSSFSEQLVMGPRGLSGRIGTGGFGEVFVGFHQKHGPLAIKKAHKHLPIDHNLAMKFFNAEVKYLSQFRHKNIVPILGFSKNGPTMCIVCEYIDGGSLEEKLSQKVLNEKQRIDIMIGTAEGLKYLHGNGENDNEISRNSESDSQNSKKNNFLHGDVKSANILLTRDCVPKLCDFGLAKQFDTTFIMTSPMGTSAYMAPEGFSGTITQKIDIYSYGIVLLELLTGLKAIIDNNSEKINIKLYIEESCIDNNITKLLDPVVNKWIKANQIYDLALKCLERQRKIRPSIVEVCEILYNTVYDNK